MAKIKKKKKSSIKIKMKQSPQSKGRASSEYMKYGDVKKVSDVDTRTVLTGRGTFAIGDHTPSQWAQRLVTSVGGFQTAGKKFRHSGSTYKIKQTGTPTITSAELVKT